MNRLTIYAAVISIIIAAGAPAVADGINGTQPMICAPTQTFDCDPGRQCIADSPEAVNLPRLIRLDFAAKQAFTKEPNGEERVAQISSRTVQDGELMLQGVQNGFGWTMMISQDSGDMTLTIAGKGAGFVVFGNCSLL